MEICLLLGLQGLRSNMWGGSSLPRDTDSKAELTSVIVQCSEKGILSHTEKQERGTENASLQGVWEKMECEEASQGRQAQSKLQAGLSWV